MAKKGSYIVDYFNNRGFFGLSILLLVVFSVIASGNFVVPQRGYGTFHNIATWIESSDTSCFVAVVANVVIGVLLVTLNIMFRYIKTYNCFVFAAVFVLLQGINPFLSTRFFAGTALCLVVVVTLFFMFEQYGKRGGASQGIFLVMALLSFFTIYHYVVAFLINDLKDFSSYFCEVRYYTFPYISQIIHFPFQLMRSGPCHILCNTVNGFFHICI